jgi:hypothetical protein
MNLVAYLEFIEIGHMSLADVTDILIGIFCQTM